MSTSIVICADATSGMGTGHVMRCLALAQAAKQQGMTVCFTGKILVPWVRERLAREHIPVTYIPGKISGAEVPEDVLARWEGILNPDWVIFDGYHFGPDCQKAVRAAGYKLLVIDDYAHLPEYSCDILLNQNIGSEEFVYKGDIGQKLLGPRYALLRPEFFAARAKAEVRRFPEKAKNILLTLGGGDFSEHLARIAPDFVLPELTGCTLRVIAGAVPEERIRALLKDCPATVEILGRVNDMPALLLDTELCVTAGGSTCWELCCMGVPFLTIKTAENQREAVNTLARRDIASPYSTAAFLRLLSDSSLRATQACRGFSLVTGNGATLALEMAMHFPFSLRSAVEADCRSIWLLANEPDIRGVSCKSGSISWEEHQIWYANRLRSPLPFWVAENMIGEFCGYIRFAETSAHHFAVSLAFVKAQRNKGVGTALLTRCCRMFLQSRPNAVLQATILAGNAASLRMFAKAGFQEAGETIIDGKRFLLFSMADQRKQP